MLELDWARRDDVVVLSASGDVDLHTAGQLRDAVVNAVGGEGGFGFRASGSGQALVSIYGAVDIIDLEAGEVVTIDTGHVVAYAVGGDL